MAKKTHIIVNSTIIYVIAFLVTTILHEFGHAILGILNGSSPVIHHNYVEHLTDTSLIDSQIIIIALAGPIVSLIQGLIAGALYLKSQRQKPVHLFLLWLSVLGFNNFFGYLMTGPVFQRGDIGKVFLILDTPLLTQILVAVIGAAILVFIAHKLTEPFLRFSYEQDWVNTAKSRKSFSFSIIILPWLIGSAIVTILYMPIIAIVSIIYPFMSGMIFIFPWQNAWKIENVKLSENKKIGELSAVLIFLLVVLIAVLKFILAPGIQL